MAIDIFQVGAQLGAPASKVSNVRYDTAGSRLLPGNLLRPVELFRPVLNI